MNYIVEVRPKNKARALAIIDQQVLRVILKAENGDVAKQRAEGCFVKTWSSWRRHVKLSTVLISYGTAGDYMDTAIILDPADHLIPHVIMDCLVVRP